MLVYYVSKKITKWIVSPVEETFNKQKDFIADASHELKTPIAVILGQANLLRRWGKDDPIQLEKSINTIIAETKTMENIVSNLLQLSKLETGLIAPKMSLINLKLNAKNKSL